MDSIQSNLQKGLLLILFFCFFSFSAKSQKHSLGEGLGISNFLGDLGGANDIGTPFLKDLEVKAFRPSIQVDYRYLINSRFNVRAGLTFTQLVGNDAWLNPDGLQDPSYYRWYRNLHFRSNLVELALQLEFNILRYAPGDLSNKWTPYLGIGVGTFFFNPKAEYQGQWIALQPLGTEGQGLPGYRGRYSRVQVSMPLTIGFKVNLSRKLTFGFDITHRFTTTDYIDDVSTNYVDPADLYATYVDQRANLIYALSRRSTELDPNEDYGYITAPGQQRGDPKNKDQFFTTTFSLSYVFGKNEYACPPRRQFF
jgi:hypothetical protein